MELPYIAGLFDGEGTIGITKPSPGARRRHRPVVAVCMTHERTVRALQAALGGNVREVNTSKYNPNAATRFDWRLSGQAALDFVESIRPWLITKRDQADIILRFEPGRRGVRLTDDQLMRRESLRQELARANQRGVNHA